MNVRGVSISIDIICALSMAIHRTRKPSIGLPVDLSFTLNFSSLRLFVW